MRFGEFSKPLGRLDACGRRIYCPPLDFVSFPQTMEWHGMSALSETGQGMFSATTWCPCLRGFREFKLVSRTVATAVTG